MSSGKWRPFCLSLNVLTHWGRVTHICVGNLTIIGSDNGLSPDRRQAIIWTNAGILKIGPLGTNFSEILSEIHAFSLKKIRLKMSSAKCCSFCLSLNVLTHWDKVTPYDVSVHGRHDIIGSCCSGVLTWLMLNQFWLTYCWFPPRDKFNEIWNKTMVQFHLFHCICKYHLQNVSHFFRPQHAQYLDQFKSIMTGWAKSPILTRQ